VPADGLLYVAPEMISHYVVDHDYLPPSELIEAVLRSPIPGTEEYTVCITRFRHERERPRRC